MKLAELAELMGITVEELTERLKKEETVCVKLKDSEKKERETGKITII